MAADNKRFYWLKLDEEFFEDDTIQWIEEQENGDKYVLFYLKLCLKSLKNDGILVRYVGDKLMPYDVKALAKLTNTDVDTVRIAINVFKEIGLIEFMDTGELFMKQINEMIGTETEKASLMRRKRARENKLKEQAKLEESPANFIDTRTNNEKYGGNYYAVLSRDELKCVSCGSTNNLKVHHVRPYDKSDNSTTLMSNMVTICTKCLEKEKEKTFSMLDINILSKIGFDFDKYTPVADDDYEAINEEIDSESNNVTKEVTMLPDSYSDVTKCSEKLHRVRDRDRVRDKSIEIELDIDKELEIEKDLEEDKSSLSHLERDHLPTDTTQEKTLADYKDQIINTWNNLDPNIPKVVTLKANTKRAKMLNARFNEYGIEGIYRAFEHIGRSSFLKGYNTDFVVTFDWFVRPNNFIKVLEGNYDDKTSQDSNLGATEKERQMMRDMANAMAWAEGR